MEAAAETTRPVLPKMSSTSPSADIASVGNTNRTSTSCSPHTPTGLFPSDESCSQRTSTDEVSVSPSLSSSPASTGTGCLENTLPRPVEVQQVGVSADIVSAGDKPREKIILFHVTSKLNDAASLSNVELQKAPDSVIKLSFPAECSHMHEAEGMYRRMTPEDACVAMGLHPKTKYFNCEKRSAEALARCGLAPSGDRRLLSTSSHDHEEDVDPFGDDFRFFSPAVRDSKGQDGEISAGDQEGAGEDHGTTHFRRTMPLHCSVIPWNWIHPDLSQRPSTENCILRDPRAPVYVHEVPAKNSDDSSSPTRFFVINREYSLTLQGSWCLNTLQVNPAGDDDLFSRTTRWANTMHAGHKSILDDSYWFVPVYIMQPSNFSWEHGSGFELPPADSPLRFREDTRHTAFGWLANIQISAFCSAQQDAAQGDGVQDDERIRVRDVQHSIARRLMDEWQIPYVSPRSVLLRRNNDDDNDGGGVPLPTDLREYFLDPEDVFDATLDDYEFVVRSRDFSPIIEAVNFPEFATQPRSLQALRTFVQLVNLDCGLEIPRAFLAEVLVEDLANVNPFAELASHGGAFQGNDLLPTLPTLIMNAALHDVTDACFCCKDADMIDVTFPWPSFVGAGDEVTERRLQEKTIVLFGDCMDRMADTAFSEEERTRIPTEQRRAKDLDPGIHLNLLIPEGAAIHVTCPPYVGAKTCRGPGLTVSTHLIASSFSVLGVHRPTLERFFALPGLDIEKAFLSLAAVGDGAVRLSGFTDGEDPRQYEFALSPLGGGMFEFLRACQVYESGADSVSEKVFDGIIRTLLSRCGIDGFLTCFSSAAEDVEKGPQEDAGTDRKGGPTIFYWLICALGDVLLVDSRAGHNKHGQQEKFLEEAARIRVMATVSRKIIECCECRPDLLRSALFHSFQKLARHVAFCLSRLFAEYADRNNVVENAAVFSDTAAAVDSCLQTIVRVMFEGSPVGHDVVLGTTHSGQSRAKSDFVALCMKPLSFLSPSMLITDLCWMPGLQGSVRRLLNAGLALGARDAMRSALTLEGRARIAVFGDLDIFRIWAEDIIGDRTALITMLNTIYVDPQFPELKRSCLYLAILHDQTEVALHLIRQGLAVPGHDETLLPDHVASRSRSADKGENASQELQGKLISDSTLFLPGTESGETLLHLAISCRNSSPPCSDVSALQALNDSIEARREQFLASFHAGERTASEEEKRVYQSVAKTWRWRLSDPDAAAENDHERSSFDGLYRAGEAKDNLLPYLMFPKGMDLDPVSCSEDSNMCALDLALLRPRNDGVAEWVIANFDWRRYPFVDFRMKALMAYVPVALTGLKTERASQLLLANAVTFETLFGKKNWYCTETGRYQGPPDEADRRDGKKDGSSWMPGAWSPDSVLLTALQYRSADECLALCDRADQLWRLEGFPDVLFGAGRHTPSTSTDAVPALVLDVEEKLAERYPCSPEILEFPTISSIADLSEYGNATTTSSGGDAMAIADTGFYSAWCAPNWTPTMDLFYHRQTPRRVEGPGRETTLLLAAKKLTSTTREADPEGRLFLRILQHACRSWPFLLRSGEESSPMRSPFFQQERRFFFSKSTGNVLHVVLTSGCGWAARLLLDKEKIGVEVLSGAVCQAGQVGSPCSTLASSSRATPWLYHEGCLLFSIVALDDDEQDLEEARVEDFLVVANSLVENDENLDLRKIVDDVIAEAKSLAQAGGTTGTGVEEGGDEDSGNSNNEEESDDSDDEEESDESAEEADESKALWRKGEIEEGGSSDEDNSGGWWCCRKNR